MLPPGIFLWETGDGAAVSPLDISALSESHSFWAVDVNEYGPWNKRMKLDGLGSFIQSPVSSDSTIVITGKCETTMETARLLADKGVIESWGAVLAVEQSSGRGQLRRPWVSPPGNLHMSVVMPPVPAVGEWHGALADLLPLVCGYVVGSVIEELGATLKIKWPNDILQENRKVGGMLVEERGDIVVLGLGVNLAESPSDDQMREDHSVPAGVLQTNRHVLTALNLGETLVSRGKSVYVGLLDENTPSGFLRQLQGRIAWFGDLIEVREGSGESYRAMITGIAPNGGLVVRRGEREAILTSGSIFSL